MSEGSWDLEEEGRAMKYGICPDHGTPLAIWTAREDGVLVAARLGCPEVHPPEFPDDDCNEHPCSRHGVCHCSCNCGDETCDDCPDCADIPAVGRLKG